MTRSAPTHVECGSCGRKVPTAPGYYSVSCAHTRAGKPCRGNDRQRSREILVHPSQNMARQMWVLQTDAFWDLPSDPPETR